MKPTAAANDARLTRVGLAWRTICRGVLIALARAILNPLPHVAQHVAETKGIGRKATCGRCMEPSIAAGDERRTAPIGPGVCTIVRRRLSPRPGGNGARTCRILPLGFR